MEKRKSVEKLIMPPIAKSTTRKLSSSNSQHIFGDNKHFRSLGGRVKNLIRFNKAFGSTEKEEDDIITSDKLLPSEPRFSTSLSPAAQFAMMKGYEDMVYDNICKYYPASKMFLKRNKTPPKGYIDLNNVKLAENNANHDVTQKSDNDSQNSGNNSDKHAEHELKEQNELEKTIDTNENIVNLKLDPVKRQNSQMKMKDVGSVQTLRPNSFPLISKPGVPREKRLVLSHRLQSAMDILDTVRGNFGCHSISPRIKGYPRKIKPVSDFNQWSTIWSDEFKINRFGKK
ncbi:unnamed protein product [Mytilus coruscus]|uniref:Uncharacterized protein n=1 Tax=Mytilus coruscus TaxID=42192 RepID=A0A6J8ETE4_MYTCO|nr:unnamed protein product [Mytilus coruscus]